MKNPHPGRRLKPHPGRRLTVRRRRLARLLDVSERHLQAMNSAGKLPRPMKLGRCRVWYLAEIRAWLRAGCPDRQTWEAGR
jgi:predicted DNA-binding transcriptional regulator AlpA